MNMRGGVMVFALTYKASDVVDAVFGFASEDQDVGKQKAVHVYVGVAPNRYSTEWTVHQTKAKMECQRNMVSINGKSHS